MTASNLLIQPSDIHFTCLPHNSDHRKIYRRNDFNRHVDYIHWNPVKHGHVTQVGDWPYSTFHRYVAEGIYPADWGGGEAKTAAEADFGE
ncbi:hypothetical protein BN874_1930001 [Candidatus Contendobacter odensis Run_B_J11]|uniref:Transposase n=1 Tax=Candidatus Contendobacter odensis Run_B_J11 TaxID=1400861 RepID=A0A7U7J441_9GAMM|nr:hypothetical protein BN874_1930001 [Candidatus Contendobacter odensis Run_B_J11]